MPVAGRGVGVPGARRELCLQLAAAGLPRPVLTLAPGLLHNVVLLRVERTGVVHPPHPYRLDPAPHMMAPTGANAAATSHGDGKRDPGPGPWKDDGRCC